MEMNLCQYLVQSRILCMVLLFTIMEINRESKTFSLLPQAVRCSKFAVRDTVPRTPREAC